MIMVTRIIVIMVMIVFISGCGKQEQSDSHLPQKVDHPTRGKVTSISPEELVNSLNGGADLNMYFLHDALSEDPNYFVDIPGMKSINLGDMFYIADTLNRNEPVYLISLYGSNARKIALEVVKRGVDVVCLDGGSYRLSNEMRQRKMRFLPR